MKKTVTVSVGMLVVVGIALFIGYLWGRSTIQIPEPKTIVETKWLKGETIIDTIFMPIPYLVTVTDTVPVFVATDTAKLYAVWQDYYLQRHYNLDFSNDTLGVFKMNAVVGQNKLVSAAFTIQPNIRTVIERQVIYKVPRAQFYGIMGSSIDLRTNKIQFGVDLRQKYMIGVSGIRLDDKYGYTIDVGIKF